MEQRPNCKFCFFEFLNSSTARMPEHYITFYYITISCSYVPVTGVLPLPSDTYDLRLEAGTVCGVMVAGLAAPGMLHESVSLKGKAASIRS